ARMQDALQMILRTFLWDVPMEGYLGDPWGATAPTALVAWREGKVRQVMLCLEQHELARRPCEWSAIRINHRLDPCPAPCRGVGKPRATAGIVRRDPRWRRSMAGSPRALTRLTCRRPGPSWQPWPEPPLRLGFYTKLPYPCRQAFGLLLGLLAHDAFLVGPLALLLGPLALLLGPLGPCQQHLPVPITPA